MEEDIREALRSIQQAQRDQRREIDDLASSLVRLVRGIEQDERADERAERSRENERDKLIEALEELKDAVENVGVSMRNLPETLLNTIEKKIYELRTARFEALQAGVANEPAPLFPAPTHRDPTGRFRVPPAHALPPHEEEDALVLTPQQQRGIRRWFAEHWKWVRYTVPPALLEIGHRVYDAIKHAIGH